MRRDFFGPDGDTTWVLERLRRSTRRFHHYDLDIRDRPRLLALVDELRPELILHCASQPSHDLAKDRPFDDFEVNAVATLNLLEAARRSCPESPFVFLSTNKVYGDAPNELPLVELATRVGLRPRSTTTASAKTAASIATSTASSALRSSPRTPWSRSTDAIFGMPTGLPAVDA
jgi:nucleoside-diphosphate-sugar epimerase